VEEQFYIIWPVLIHWLSRKRLFALSLLIIGLSPLARDFVSSLYGYPAVYVFTLCRLDALASGAVLALLISNQRWNVQTIIACRKLAPLALLVLLTTFLVPFSPSFPEARPHIFTLFGYTWIGVAFAVLVGASLRCEGWAWSLLNGGVLTFVGKRCYGLYLWHALVAGLVKKLADASSVPIGIHSQLSLWLLSLLVVASMSWSFFERPILNLKRLVPYPILLGRASAAPTLS
jgi:peptidoglycan/LPS O-acetylase OafA/YrhL